MTPRSGRRTPSTHSIVVVFPAPFGPINPKISPSLTSNETSDTATVVPYVLRMPETWITLRAPEMPIRCPPGVADGWTTFFLRNPEEHHEEYHSVSRGVLAGAE